MVSFVNKEKVLRCMNICWESQSDIKVTTPPKNGKILKYTAQLMTS